MVDATKTAVPNALATSRRAGLRRLWPLDGGPNEIKAMDGLRAAAALSVIFHHGWATSGGATLVAGTAFLWSFARTGVHLFFVLSGFLLFMPYARAMLLGRPLPSARGFYRRRALRILPAYLACLAIVFVMQPQYHTPDGIKDLAAHLLFIHDFFPAYINGLNSVFWTLALEMQFYLVLPLIAAAIARFVGTGCTALRLGSGVLAIMLVALCMRGAFAFRDTWLPFLPDVLRTAARLLLPLTFGTVGKFLEVFALGMLCSVLYVAHHELGRLAALGARLLSPALIACGLGLYVVLARAPGVQVLLQAAVVDLHGSRRFLLAATTFPLAVASAYALILLGVLWGRGWVRALFEWAPLRFVGLVSYSLYLWHLPIMLWAQDRQLAGAVSANARLIVQLAVGVGVAIPVAWLSYQLVERPFLKRRNRLERGEVQVGVTASVTMS